MKHGDTILVAMTTGKVFIGRLFNAGDVDWGKRNFLTLMPRDKDAIVWIIPVHSINYIENLTASGSSVSVNT